MVAVSGEVHDCSLVCPSADHRPRRVDLDTERDAASIDAIDATTDVDRLARPRRTVVTHAHVRTERRLAIVEMGDERGGARVLDEGDHRRGGEQATWDVGDEMILANGERRRFFQSDT
jgi:hypothetical protein